MPTACRQRDAELPDKASMGCSGSAAKSPGAKNQTLTRHGFETGAALFKCFRNVIKSGNASVMQPIGAFGALNPASRSTPRGGERLMRTAARDSVPEDASPATADIGPESENRGEMVATVATVAAAGIAAAAFEVALLPGMVLGIAAIWAPRHLPQIGAALNPLLRNTIRGTYKIGHKTREIMAEAQEQVRDMIAAVEAERDRNLKASKSAASANEGAW
jgi:hypothetical protein